jgi:tetratricopeptide (TPR) repeat protein
MQKLYSIVVFLFFLSNAIEAQRLVDVINQAEKAVVTIKTYSANGTLVSEGSGCVISSDGIALVTANCLFEGDSVLVELKPNRRFGLSTILQVNPMFNLALVKLNTGRLRDLAFLLPSRPVFREEQEVIVFGHPSEVEDGMAFGRIGAIGNYVFMNRHAQIAMKATNKSNGAPIVNAKGEMVGVVNAYDKQRNALVVESKFMNDTNWISINKTYVALKKSPQTRSLFSADMNDGLLRLIAGEYELSARSLSAFTRLNPTYVPSYVLRSHARYMYKNTYGSREDLATIKKLDPNGYLHFYFEAQHLYAENKKEEALINYGLCLQRKPNFAYALVERGRLNYLIKRNLESAYTDYIAAIAADSTYGAAYYEKARFVLQHFEDRRSASSDIDDAIRLDPQLPGVYTIRGTMRIESQNYLQAIRDFDKALEKDSKDASALFNRGLANYNLGMKDKACNDWQKATNMGHYKAVRYISRYCGQR